MRGRQKGHRTETTPERIEVFLDTLAEVGLLGDAAMAAGFDRSWIWHLRQMSPCFSEQCEEAITRARIEGRIVESLSRGAMGLDEEVVIYKGQVVMVWYDEQGRLIGNKLRPGVTKKSAEAKGWNYGPLVKRTRDTRAATALLAAMDPERYGRTRMELTGKNGGPIQTQSVLVVPDPQAVNEWGTGEVIDEEEPED